MVARLSAGLPASRMEMVFFGIKWLLPRVYVVCVVSVLYCNLHDLCRLSRGFAAEQNLSSLSSFSDPSLRFLLTRPMSHTNKPPSQPVNECSCHVCELSFSLPSFPSPQLLTIHSYILAEFSLQPQNPRGSKRKSGGRGSNGVTKKARWRGD